MSKRTFLPFISSLLLTVLAGYNNVTAMPQSATDETKAPHYFGPYPNWANSPLTLPDARVTITGDGTGATAVATVGANGAISAIDVTDGGRGYGNAKVVISGSGTGASADATIIKKGAVVDIAIGNPGSGYTAPAVTLSGNGTGAAASAYGSVGNVTLANNGTGFTFPTVDFDLPDGPNGVQARGHADCLEAGCKPIVAPDGTVGTVTVTGVVVDNPGSGYSTAPGVTVRDGTIFDPIPKGAAPMQGASTLLISSVVIDNSGSNYSKMDVAITDPTGTGATATASLDNGVISAITLKKPGSGYVTPGGLKKFVDTLPGLGPAAANNLGQYIPVAKSDTTTFANADYYEIALVEYTEKMHSALPPTKLRGYVQLSKTATGKTITVNGQTYNVMDNPHYLGPTIVAQKGRPVRITFYNLLPTGAGGDLFLPTDSTMMGSGMGPMPMTPPTDLSTVMDDVRNPACTEHNATVGKPSDCFKDNRATLHLHGGNTPWISDGTPHQWITPQGETTNWHKGVSVQNVPDMWFDASGNLIASCAGQTTCAVANATNNPGDGAQTFYYTNQQSSRLMFYHDHAWGITRLNVYAGEAAGYLIQDSTETALVNNGTIPGAADTIPLIVQDRTFVPDVAQLAQQDPTWDSSRWGAKGNLWYHHVYMPAQNPGDASGMSAFGRWMYGPWFWPPAKPEHGPIANPYYNMNPNGPDGIRGTADDFTQTLAKAGKPNCNLDDPATWQYQTDPFCEPAFIPGTPNISAGMEQFNDTPIVNGTAYPTVTLKPQSYRLRILNAANDRFFNLQWYVADSTGTEVALKAAEVAAAQTDPNVFPTPDTTKSPAGPSWIQIGTEGGFLPAPAVVPNQPITWITDPTRFDFGNVDKHAMLIAPAERADVIVDFSKFAGKTLILYNDAPAAFPARVPAYDYYTGGPDLSPMGAPTVLPGYGPNTRTVMQVKIASGSGKAFNLSALQTAFSHKANGTGVFESGQHPIIVGQSAYNSAYGTSFAASGDCSNANGTNKCDGLARINQQGGDLFRFDTLKGATNGTWSKLSIPLEPKGMHDEMNAVSFDEFGRMMANLGLEMVPATPALQNILMYQYIHPTTELIDATKLPKADVKVQPIASVDGTQIWKITHNGVDTHPIHFHAYDVQLLNRVTWDNIIIKPDANELGWKDTVRVSPLEDTIVALRPVIPSVPFDLPNSVRLLSPMMSEGAELISQTPTNLFDPTGAPVNSLLNHYVNFGAEYVYHCHILSHEEMDMMRPVSIALPPTAPSGLVFDPNNKTLTWTDKSLSETAFVVKKLSAGGTDWNTATKVGQVSRTLIDQNTAGATESITDVTWVSGDQYRVEAQNTVGDTETAEFPTLSVTSVSQVLTTP